MSNIQSISLPAALGQSRSERTRIWHVFRHHRLAVASALLLILFTFVGIFADRLTPYDPNATNTAYAKGKPQPPSAEYTLGTDHFGRDYFSRTISAIRISLFVGVAAVAFQLLIGVSVGATAGYFGGYLDNFLMRVTDVFLSIPGFMLLLIMAGILGGTLPALIIAIGGLNWMTVARLVRAEFLSLCEREFVLAGRYMGASSWRLITPYLLPNTLSSIVISEPYPYPVPY